MSRALSDEAKAYIGGRPAAERSLAETYAKMPGDEFQARIGPLIDLMQASLTRRAWWRSALSDAGKVLGGIGAGFLAFWRLGGN